MMWYALPSSRGGIIQGSSVIGVLLRENLSGSFDSASCGCTRVVEGETANYEVDRREEPVEDGEVGTTEPSTMTEVNIKCGFGQESLDLRYNTVAPLRPDSMFAVHNREPKLHDCT